jgi:hypothetical protein
MRSSAHNLWAQPCPPEIFFPTEVVFAVDLRLMTRQQAGVNAALSQTTTGRLYELTLSAAIYL